jgi:hypothetical protein
MLRTLFSIQLIFSVYQHIAAHALPFFAALRHRDGNYFTALVALGARR